MEKELKLSSLESVAGGFCAPRPEDSGNAEYMKEWRRNYRKTLTEEQIQKEKQVLDKLTSKHHIN